MHGAAHVVNRPATHVNAWTRNESIAIMASIELCKELPGTSSHFRHAVKVCVSMAVFAGPITFYVLGECLAADFQVRDAFSLSFDGCQRKAKTTFVVLSAAWPSPKNVEKIEPPHKYHKTAPVRVKTPILRCKMSAFICRCFVNERD